MDKSHWPASLVRELLRGVCYYIADPSTFHNFALASRYCASLAKEYAPMKMDEFSTVTSYKFGKDWIVAKLLCDCSFSGWSRAFTYKTRELQYERLFARGKCIVSISDFWIDAQPAERPPTRDMLRVFSWNPYDGVTFWRFRQVEVGATPKAFYFSSPKCVISSERCPLCQRFHVFFRTQKLKSIYLSSSGLSFFHDAAHLCMFVDCLGRRFPLSEWSVENVQRYYLRRSVARGVIDYARAQ